MGSGVNTGSGFGPGEAVKLKGTGSGLGPVPASHQDKDIKDVPPLTSWSENSFSPLSSSEEEEMLPLTDSESEEEESMTPSSIAISSDIDDEDLLEAVRQSLRACLLYTSPSPRDS